MSVDIREIAMRAISMTAGLLLVAAPLAGAAAQDASSPADGRYAMTPAPNGFLRLDTRTGAVSLCAVSGETVACRAAADERAALQDEIDRLMRENADLRGQTAQSRSRYGIPSDRDIDRALGVGGRFMKRFMQMLRDEPPRSKT
jgi:hypothetical protein